MTSTNQRIGRIGEDRAACHLHDNGWLILDRNWRSRDGELDIVALDGDALVACEVKTRFSPRVGDPAEAVSARKARRLRLLLTQWQQVRRHPAQSLRIDVVAVRLKTDGRYDLTHLRGVA